MQAPFCHVSLLHHLILQRENVTLVLFVPTLDPLCPPYPIYLFCKSGKWTTYIEINVWLTGFAALPLNCIVLSFHRDHCKLLIAWYERLVKSKQKGNFFYHDLKGCFKILNFLYSWEGWIFRLVNVFLQPVSNRKSVQNIWWLLLSFNMQLVVDFMESLEWILFLFRFQILKWGTDISSRRFETYDTNFLKFWKTFVKKITNIYFQKDSWRLICDSLH